MPNILIHVSTVVPNGDGKILMVREAKAVHRGMWNLPGGHVELREGLKAAALREVREETGLEVELDCIIGVYNAVAENPDSRVPHSIRHLFLSKPIEAVPVAGDEIIEVAWMNVEDVLALPDEALVGARYLRSCLEDHRAGRRFDLAIIREN